jgi:CubicO group peptidase (beta-lactamase class C family)
MSAMSEFLTRAGGRVTGIALAAIAAVALLSPAASTQAARYFPPEGRWDTRAPADLGVDKAKLDEAVAFAVASQATSNRNLAEAIPRQFQNEAPYNNLIGPTQERAAMSGLVIRRGYLVAEWGDTIRADMTFSVTKTFLSTVVGEAVERGLIKDVQDKVAPYMPAGVDLFSSPHNAKITWDHLLRQTSDWSGTLWGKPDWADRPPRGQTPEEWPKRAMNEPGTVYKYNDTRVNVLALATLYVMKEPLPVVLEREIMDPIGASSTWHWEPYENAYVTIDGKRMPSIPGGGHHGGGMFISAWDMARFGYLFLNNGKWGDRELVTGTWIAMAKAPGAVNKQYGFMNWFLNTPTGVDGNVPRGMMYPTAPQTAVAFRGNGENIIYIDWDNDMVVVLRWASRTAQVIERILAAVK